MRPLLGLLVVASLGCASDAPRTVEPAPSAAPTTSAAPVVSAAPSSSSEPIASGLPAGDACETVADCGLSYTYLIDGKCCRGTCSPEPQSTGVLTAIDDVCAARGFEEQRCPVKKCVAPKPIACVDRRCVFVQRTGPIESRDDALDRATEAANAALDKAYAKSLTRPGALQQLHTSRWAEPDRASIEGPTKAGGYTFKWSSFPPAGFSHECEVQVDKDGKVTVKKAEAGFSPD